LILGLGTIGNVSIVVQSNAKMDLVSTNVDSHGTLEVGDTGLMTFTDSTVVYEIGMSSRCNSALLSKSTGAEKSMLFF
jgi:hypothetical protein